MFCINHSINQDINTTHRRLQQGFTSIEYWLTRWSLHISMTKSKVIDFSPKIQWPPLYITTTEDTFPQQSTIRILGMHLHLDSPYKLCQRQGQQGQLLPKILLIPTVRYPVWTVDKDSQHNHPSNNRVRSTVTSTTPSYLTSPIELCISHGTSHRLRSSKDYAHTHAFGRSGNSPPLHQHKTSGTKNFHHSNLSGYQLSTQRNLPEHPLPAVLPLEVASTTVRPCRNTASH